MNSLRWNLIIAWTWILMGFISGMGLGMFFHRESWLGGYSSLKRRMYRLAHISFFGLGTVNLLFYFTTRVAPFNGGLTAASIALIAGAVSMPICCVLMAHFPKARLLFCIPVLSLLLGGGITLGHVASGGEGMTMRAGNESSLAGARARQNQ